MPDIREDQATNLLLRQQVVGGRHRPRIDFVTMWRGANVRGMKHHLAILVE